MAAVPGPKVLRGGDAHMRGTEAVLLKTHRAAALKGEGSMVLGEGMSQTWARRAGMAGR